MIKLIKTIMAKLVTKRFVLTPEDVEQKVQPMSKVEILESLMQYKKQNPVKWLTKKEALLARYGFALEDEPEELKDEEDEKLEAIKKLITKKK